MIIKQPILIATPRTGGILILNILQSLLRIKVRSTHFYRRTPKPGMFIYERINTGKYGKIISTYRDLRNSVISNIKFDGNTVIDKNLLKNHVRKKLESAKQLNFLRDNYSDDEILFLKYETFTTSNGNNFDYIFDSLESFFEITFSEYWKNHVRNNFDINNIKKTLSTFADKNNQKINIKFMTGLRRRHINDDISDWMDLPSEYHKYFEPLYPFLETWGYEI